MIRTAVKIDDSIKAQKQTSKTNSELYKKTYKSKRGCRKYNHIHVLNIGLITSNDITCFIIMRYTVLHETNICKKYV